MEDLAEIKQLAPGVYLLEECIPPPHVLDLIVSAASDAISRSGERPSYIEVIVECGSRLEGYVHVEYETGLSHEAYAGYPRIHVDIYKFTRVPRDLQRAMLVHEFGHAMLHGAPEFYMARLSSEEDLLAAHAAYTIVKDLEVSLWMEVRGFHNENILIREYFDRVINECVTREAVIDEGRRLAVYYATGEKPVGRCGRISDKLYQVIGRVAECKPRPWSCRHEVFEFMRLVL